MYKNCLVAEARQGPQTFGGSSQITKNNLYSSMYSEV